MKTDEIRKCLATLKMSNIAGVKDPYSKMREEAEGEIKDNEKKYMVLAKAAADAMDVMGEAIENGLRLGDADWAQMIKCKEAIAVTILSSKPHKKEPDIETRVRNLESRLYTINEEVCMVARHSGKVEIENAVLKEALTQARHRFEFLRLGGITSINGISTIAGMNDIDTALGVEQ